MPEKRIIAIDSQKLETIQLCEQKWNYTFTRQLVPPTTKDYFERGDLLHLMLAKFYNDRIDGKVVQESCDAAVNDGYRHATTLNLSGDECEIVIKNFLEYCTHFAGDQWQPVFVEKVAAKVIFEDEKFQIIYQGKIDLGVNIPNVDGVVPVDHKSAKRRGSELDLNNQFMGYCWLLECNNLVKNEIGFQKTLKPSERFRRIMFSYSSDRINEWVTNSVKWIKRLIYCIESDEWLMNLSSCNKFDGCIFSGICTSTPDAREGRVTRDFAVSEKPWDVGVLL